MTFNAELKLVLPLYEEEIRQALREAVIDQIQREVNKGMKTVRAAIAQELQTQQKHLIKQAVETITNLQLDKVKQ